MPKSKKPKVAHHYLDLFSGCGGLSVGLERAGWELEFAVEKSAMAAETFAFNILNMDESDFRALLGMKKIDQQVSKRLAVADVEAALKLTKKELRAENISLVVGGPPCQGFSLAGNRNSEDTRNELPLRFIEMVMKVKPKFVVMENVVGMHSKFSPDQEVTVFEKIAELLEGKTTRGSKYLVQKVLANAVHYGAAQSRPRLLLIACESDFARSRGISVTDDIWKSDFSDFLSTGVPDLAPIPIPSSDKATVRDAFSDLLGTGETNYTVLLKSEKIWGREIPTELKNHNFRKHSDKTIEKLGLFTVATNLGLPKEALRRDNKMTSSKEFKKKLDGFKYPIGLGEGTTLKIRDADHFLQLLREHCTAKHSQRPLNLDLPSPTITTSPDDFIHPMQPRSLTVREMARLQGFPDSFIFKAKETTGGLKRRTEVPQYTQVGNAVSPFLAYKLGERLKSYLS